jgi:hypothetical protein
MLFRDENPALGPTTSVKELSGVGSGQPTFNYYKPTTRQFAETQFSEPTLVGSLTGWIFRAPWKCQIIAAELILATPATTSVTVQAYTVPYASQPEAPSAGNAIFAAAQNLSSATATANTSISIALETTTSTYLTMNPGDLLGYVFSGTSTGIAGGLLQVEIVQIG